MGLLAFYKYNGQVIRPALLSVTWTKERSSEFQVSFEEVKLMLIEHLLHHLIRLVWIAFAGLCICLIKINNDDRKLDGAKKLYFGSWVAESVPFTEKPAAASLTPVLDYGCLWFCHYST